MIQRIVNGDFFTVVDRFGRFHTNLTNLKASFALPALSEFPSCQSRSCELATNDLLPLAC